MKLVVGRLGSWQLAAAAAARGRLLLVATVSLLPSLLQGHKQLPPPPDCQATGIPAPPTPSFLLSPSVCVSIQE